MATSVDEVAVVVGVETVLTALKVVCGASTFHGLPQQRAAGCG